MMLGLGVRGALGQVPLPEPLELNRFRTRRARFLNGVSRQLEKDLTREGVFFGCSGSSSKRTSLRSPPAAIPASAIRIATIRSSAVGTFRDVTALDPRPLPPSTFGTHVLLAIAYSACVVDRQLGVRDTEAEVVAQLRKAHRSGYSL